MADAEIKQLLTALTTNMNNNHATLSSKIDAINERIDETNRSITAEIHNLEGRVFSEINKLQDTQVEQQREIKQIKERLEGEIVELAHELKAQREIIKNRDDQIVRLERACHTGLQHNRGWNLEIDGIPSNVGEDPLQLERAVIQLLNNINVLADEYDIDTVHRLPSQRSPKTTIVRFNSRKVVRDIHLNKNKLRNLDELNLEIPGINADSKIFIRASQSPYVKNLAYNCRLLKRSNRIAQTITGKDGRLTIKTLDGDFIKIGHEQDLRVNFPDYGNFSFNYQEPTE